MASLNMVDMASRTKTKKWVRPDNKRTLKPARQDGSMPEATKVTPARKRSPLYDRSYSKRNED